MHLQKKSYILSHTLLCFTFYSNDSNGKIQEVLKHNISCDLLIWPPNQPRFRDVANTPLWLESFDLLLCDLDGGSTSTEFARVFGEHKAGDVVQLWSNKTGGLGVGILMKDIVEHICVYRYIFAMVTTWNGAEALPPREQHASVVYFIFVNTLRTLKYVSSI